MQSDASFQRGFRPALDVPDTGAALLAWQTDLEQRLDAALEQEFAVGLGSIRTLAVNRSLTPASATALWEGAVSRALAKLELDVREPAVSRLRDELIALDLGAQAYEAVMTVDRLFQSQLSRPAPEEYLAALEEVLGLESATASLTAAGGLGDRLRRRLLDWMRPVKSDGLTWRSQIRRGVRTGFTGLTGSLVTAKLSALGARTKRWVSKDDDATRPSHREADGQEVPLNAPFNVGGQLLMFPGDPRASIAETVNCRCVMVAGDS